MLSEPLSSLAKHEIHPEDVYSVSELNAHARMILEEGLQTIWITGEISNLSQPSSGHLYFSLKDEHAQVRCAFFRNYQRRLNVSFENGQQVLVQAQVSLYETRGDFQLIVVHAQLAGEGALQIAFEKLKQKLDQEGLFSPEYKKPLPPFPRTIGVITSASGAAVRDVLKVIHRRFPTPVIIYPTLVQGDKAAKQIAEAIHLASARRECDVLLLVRGGGSLEDLWPFNEEIVARAIFASKIPMVTGIGHEIDFTIADFVADHRAPTPSAAAELATPQRTEWLQQITSVYKRLSHLIMTTTQHKHSALKHLHAVLNGCNPFIRITHTQSQCEALKHRLITSVQHRLTQRQQKIAEMAHALEAISPLTTLNRGYAIVLHDKKIIREASEVQHGDRVSAKLFKGSIDCLVESTHNEE